jgi:hypothetical protein
VSDDFVDLETDKGILSHPFDFLTQCGVAIEKLAVQVDMNGNDVRLVVPGARQASDIRPGEHCAALSLRHLLNYHGDASHNEDLPGALARLAHRSVPVHSSDRPMRRSETAVTRLLAVPPGAPVAVRRESSGQINTRTPDQQQWTYLSGADVTRSSTVENPAARELIRTFARPRLLFQRDWARF